ncbi:MAG: hypothetical protein QNK37_16610 [Acidobacteriota bacterium]|nr:hypothetical protein [Acidobacteriota bacterium]
MATKHKRLGEMLVEANLITEAQLRGALGRQQRWGGRLGANLIKLGNISEHDLLRFLAAQTGIREMDISGIQVLPHIIKMVPEKVADKYSVMPIAMKDAHTLMVACADPTDLSALDHLSFVTGHKIEPVIASHTQILAAINKFYRGGRAKAPEPVATNGDDDLTVELSPMESQNLRTSLEDPELIIFGQAKERKPRPPANQDTLDDTMDRSLSASGRYTMGPPPNMPDPFQPGSPAMKAAPVRSPMESDEFTLDFTPDWGAPAPRTKPASDIRTRQSAPQRKQQPNKVRQFTIEQKMRALYNVLIRKGLVKEAEIQQELMRLWSMGKL